MPILTWHHHTAAADLSAARPWCESPLPLHPKVPLLDWDLLTVEVIWLQWTQCYVQETSLRWHPVWCSAVVVALLHTSWLPSYQLKVVRSFSSNLWHQQGIFTVGAAAHWIFPIFQTISVNCRDGCVGMFWNTQTSSPGSNSDQHLKSLKSPLCELPQVTSIMHCIF